LGQAIAKEKVVEAAAKLWDAALKDELSHDATIDAAFTWPGLDGSPSLVRLKVNGDGLGGPWVAVSRGKPGTTIGPFTMHSPRGFILDGLSYLAFEVAVCRECGGVGAEIHAVEAGKLRRVLESFANAN
jgi:hypothetical protein